MSDDRPLFLAHKPSGLAVRLGKRGVGTVWSVPDPELLAEQLQELFNFCDGPERDEFVLAMEQAPTGSGIEDDWVYEETRDDGLYSLLFPQ